jgi:tetratricopeptide (TPR) repeat protein
VITVFDVGTFGGDVFVAMEYVKGLTLREWWKAEARPPRATVGILVQAGRGLAAAHDQGILHRDFKPENVLVDESGRARVLDFGLARSSAGEPEKVSELELDDTLVGKRPVLDVPVTQFGTVLGTPAYMPPEQLDGRFVDARSDQFAFCVAAFEALCGERPFVGETVSEILASIRAGRVRTPAKAAGVPRGVLPPILRGLAAKPEDRWPSMAALLDALERAIGGGGRRAVAGALAIAAALALAGTALALSRAKGPVCGGDADALAGVWDAPARAAVAGAFRTSVASGDVEPIVARVTKALDEYTGSWVAASADACVATHVRGTQSDEALDLRTACLRGRLDDVRALTDLLRRADPALVDNAYGAVLRLRPIAACADVASLRAAYEPIRGEAMQRDVDDLRRAVADVVARLNAGRCEEAMPLVKPLVAPRPTTYLPARAEASYWAGRVEAQCGDAKGAADDLLSATADAQASHQDELVARALVSLAYVEGSSLARYDEGVDLARLAEAAARRAGAGDALFAELARSRGWVEYTQGHLEAALPLRKEALERHARIAGDRDPDALQIRAELADLEYEAGDLRECLAQEKELVEESVDILGPRHFRTGRYTLDVAETLGAQGKYDEARAWLERARPVVSGGIVRHLAFVEVVERFGLGDVDGADAELRQQIAEGEAQFGPDDADTLGYRADLAKWLVVHGKTAEGREVAAAAVKRIEGLKASDSSWYANAYAALALALARSGRASEAAPVADHGVELAEHAGAQLPFALLARAEVALGAGDAEKARAVAERALALVVKRDGIDPTIQGDLQAALAKAKR